MKNYLTEINNFSKISQNEIERERKNTFFNGVMFLF